MGRKSNKQKKREQEATKVALLMVVAGIATAIEWVWNKLQLAWAWVVDLFSPIINFFG